LLSRFLKRPQHIFILLVALLGLALSVGAFSAIKATEQYEVRDHFDQIAQDRANALEHGIQMSVEVLHTIRSLYGTSEVVERKQFHDFVERGLNQQLDIQALEWIPRVSASERPTYEERARNDGFPQFQFLERQVDGNLAPVAPRAEYFPVYFVEPYEGNEAALGFDLASSPTRLEALNRSRDSGKAVATARITLVQAEEDKFAFLVFLPVYENGSKTATVTERRENLIGFALGVFRVKDIVNQSLALASSEEVRSDIGIQLYDRSAPPDEQMLLGGGPAGNEGQVETSLRLAKSFDVAGRNWEVIVTSSASQTDLAPWMVLAAGLLFTSLLSAYPVAGVRRTAAVERLVAERTVELSQSNVQLEMEVGERKRSEEALSKSEAGNRALISAIPDLMIRLSRNGEFLDYRAAKKDVQLQLGDEFVGKNIHDAMPAALARQVMYFVQQALETGDGQTFEYQAPVPLNSRNLRDFEARIVVSGEDEVLAIVRDMTERRAIERMKDEFISVVSHELRTPLTSIRGSLGLLAGGMLGSIPEKGQRMLDIAVNNSERLIRLINDILDIERMESGEVIMDKRECDAADLMTQATDLVQKMAEEAEVTLSTTVQEARLHVDPDRIIQTLTNLLSNAVKFCPPGGTVWLTAERRRAEIRFEVRDQGRGIPNDKIESIFGRFQQVDASDSRDKGGTGLGLAISRSIVEQHGGKIWAESREGEGSTFFFTLPITDEVQTTPVTAPGGPTVLMCDDDPAVQAAVGSLLERHGYRVLAVSSGEEVLAQVAIQKPHAIILDLLMPDVDGWTILSRLKETPETEDIPIIILSVVHQDQAESSNSDIADWVEKPVDGKRLLQALKDVVARNGRAARVLVVEDDAGLAQVLIEMFRSHGVEIHHAITSREAIELSQRLAPDMLVLDLSLAEGDGYEVVEWLRGQGTLRQLLLVVYTAQDLAPREREKLRRGETYFFTKSRISPADFEGSVIGLLNRIVPREQEVDKSDSEANSSHR
jgi:signal transduction histidine kinase/CheY-like chemotaxis protein/CHASE1-domain containing sensor protein